MDFKAVQQVGTLLMSLTQPQSAQLNPELLGKLKGLLRCSDELVEYAQARLMDRLAANNAQARKLAVELCDVLFSRSKCFRHALAGQFSQFVELGVGHKPDKPLPPPAAAAVALREKSLEVIEKWHEAWGLHYPQVTAAYKYLKKQYNFPEISSRAAAAAAAEAERQRRHQQLLLTRYEQLSQEWPQQRQQLDSLLHQMRECFELLQQPVPQQPLQEHDAAASEVQQQQQQYGGLQDAVAQEAESPMPQAANTQPAAAAAAESLVVVGVQSPADEDHEWEDVAPQQQQQQLGRQGAADADFDMDELVGDFQEPTAPDPDHLARNATVLEQLSDLARQAQLAASGPLLDWLRVLTQLQLPQQHQQQERQRLLRAVVDVRAQMQAHLSEAAAYGITAGAGHAPPHQDAAQRQQQGALQAAAIPSRSLTAAAAADSEGGPSPAAALNSLPSRGQQPLQLHHHAAAAQVGNSSIRINSTLRRNLDEAAQQQQQQQQQRVHDVYANLRDPTAMVQGVYIIPKELVQQHEQARWLQHSQPDEPVEDDSRPSSSATAAADRGAAVSAKAPAAAEAGGGSKATTAAAAADVKPLHSSLREKLLAAAPQLPVSGTDWLLAHYSVNQHGMELYNHWGAVDATTSIPQDRLQQLVGYAASYYVPNKKRPQQAATAKLAASGSSGRAAGLAGGSNSTATAGSGAAVEPALTRSSERAPEDITGSGHLASSQARTASSAPVLPAAAAAAAAEAADNSARQQQQQRKRSRREEASAHNRAVIAGAFSDEGVAAALQQQLDAEAAAEAAAAAGRAGGRKGRASKPPERKGDKVRRKLLGLK